MPMDPLPDKFRAFNWNVAPRAYDGHSVVDLMESFDWVHQQTRWPAAVIYRTHKGRGVSFMEDNYVWHGSPVDDATYAKARPELLETLIAGPPEEDQAAAPTDSSDPRAEALQRWLDAVRLASERLKT